MLTTLKNCVAAIVTLVGMIGAAEGRPLAASTDYENVSLDDLVSVYEQAYTEAGFEFKKQTILKEAGREGRKMELIFEYPNPDYQKVPYFSTTRRSMANSWKD